MPSPRSLFEYLFSSSDNCLLGFRASRLGTITNLKKQFHQLLNTWLESEIEAVVACWILERRGFILGIDVLDVRVLMPMTLCAVSPATIPGASFLLAPEQLSATSLAALLHMTLILNSTAAAAVSRVMGSFGFHLEPALPASGFLHVRPANDTTTSDVATFSQCSCNNAIRYVPYYC